MKIDGPTRTTINKGRIQDQKKYVTARDATDGIAADRNDVLAFLREVALKAPRVLEAPLSLQADKRATI